MNFNFCGGQPQMSGQPGMLQSLSLKQSGSNDALLMQQQVMVKQMQELQKRQQLQQLEAMQRNALNHMHTFPNHSTRQQSQPINGNRVLDTSDYPWQSHFTAGGTNWQQREYPLATQSHSNGLMVSPEQGQAMHFMSLIPQQSSQSLYGVPVSNTGDANIFSQNCMDKPEAFHLPAPSRSLSGNPYALNAEQFSLHGANTSTKSGSEGKTSFDHASSQGVENVDHTPGFYHSQQKEVSILDGGGRGSFGSSDVSTENSSMQSAASQPTSSQANVGLDPTEEKFLFGNDDNIWEAFGEASTVGNDGADLFNGIPSMQSGTWSALMQSAVAETCSSDVRMQEEWSGLESQNSRSQSGNQPLSTYQDNEKPPSVKVDGSQRASFGLRTISNEVSTNNATLNTNYSHNSRLPQAFSNQRSSPTESQVLQDGRRWLDSNIHESSQRPPDHHNLDLWKPVEFSTKTGFVGSCNEQLNLNKEQSVFDCSVNSSGGVAEMHATENADGRDKPENSNDGHHHSFPNHSLASNARKNLWSNAGDPQFMHGPSDIASGYAGKGAPVARMFQYHPMGDVDESSAKEFLHTQSPSPSSRLKVHEVRQTLLAPVGSSLSNMEKGRLSGFSGGNKLLHESLSTSVHPGHLLDKSAPFASSGGNFSPNQHLSQSQNMLELLHKADRSKDQNTVSDLGSTNYYRSSDTPTGGSIGPGQSHSSTSNGFNLQLVPPSREMDLSNLNDPAQCSLKSFGSPRSRLVTSEQGDKAHGWLAPDRSTQSLSPSHRPSRFDSGNNKSGHLDGSQSNPKENLSASLTSNSPSLRNPFQNHCTTVDGGQMMGDLQSSVVSSDEHAYHDQQSTDFQNQAVAKLFAVDNLDNNFTSERDRNQSGIRPSMHQMAPSWFEQRAFINGQLLPGHNVPRFPMMNAEQQFIKPPSNMVVQDSVQLESAVTDTIEIGNTSQITNIYSASGHASSLHAFVTSSFPTPLSMRPKKRKTATSELIPWNEEIGNCFKKIQNISSAEVDWAESSNRLVERGGDAIDSNGDMSPIVRPRRRLILTTKLMQQIFYPPSASILSLDGRSNYEAIVYSIARLSLGDACNLICSVKSGASPDNLISKTSERICDQYFSKVMEDFTNRAKELEDLLRLDNRASILNFRLDCQDLEKFSVMNRFGRFHARKQVDRGETSSSSDTNAISLKRCTQKYFTAHPMPRTVPDRVQCLTIN